MDGYLVESARDLLQRIPARRAIPQRFTNAPRFSRVLGF